MKKAFAFCLILCITLMLASITLAENSTPAIQVETLTKRQLERYAKGSILTMGEYTLPDGTTKPTEWIVLKCTEDQHALLISKDVLGVDSFYYFDYFERELLSTFTPEEMRQIIVELRAPTGYEDLAKEPHAFFLLPQSELEYHLGSNLSRAAVNIVDGEPSDYWVNTTYNYKSYTNYPHASYELHAYYVSSDGDTDRGFHQSAKEPNGYRPAMWIYMGRVTDTGCGELVGSWIEAEPEPDPDYDDDDDYAPEQQSVYLKTAVLTDDHRAMMGSIDRDKYRVQTETDEYCTLYLYENGVLYLNGNTYELQNGVLVCTSYGDNLQPAQEATPLPEAQDGSAFVGTWRLLDSDKQFELFADGTADLGYEDVYTWALRDGRIHIQGETPSEYGGWTKLDLYYDVAENGSLVGTYGSYFPFIDAGNLSCVHSDAGLVITGFASGTENTAELVIPAEISGIPVVRIEDGAFAASAITSVDIQGALTLGKGVFANCKQLSLVILPDDIGHIPNNTFSNCTSLTRLTFPEGTLSLGESALQGCSSLETLLLPDGLESIAYTALRDCSRLTQLEFPEGVTTMSYHHFDGCTALKDVYLPRSMTTFDVKFNGWGDDQLAADETNIVFHVWPGSAAEKWAKPKMDDDWTTIYHNYKLRHEEAPRATSVPDSVKQSNTPLIRKITYEPYSNTLLVLYENGTVTSTNESIPTSAWKDIVDIYAADGWYYTIEGTHRGGFAAGLTADGRILLTGAECPLQDEILAWRDVVKMKGLGQHITALLADGTLVTSMPYEHVQAQISSYHGVRDFSAIHDYAGGDFVVLTEEDPAKRYHAGILDTRGEIFYVDGGELTTARTFSHNLLDESNQKYHDVVSVAGSSRLTVLLMNSGRVHVCDHGWSCISGMTSNDLGWSDIVAIDVLDGYAFDRNSGETIIGYRADGSVLAVGYLAPQINGKYRHCLKQRPAMANADGNTHAADYPKAASSNERK